MYQARLAELRQVAAQRDQRHGQLAYLRIGLVGVAIAAFAVAGWQGAPIALGAVAAFIIVAVYHARVIAARDRALAAAAYYERGLRRIGDDWIGRGDPGDRFRPESHLYAEDLDLFGRGSLFELLATTRTQAGQETLAHWLLAPAEPALVRERQAAVRELAPRHDLREAMAVAGDGLPRAGIDARRLRVWAGVPPILTRAWPRVAMALASMVVLPTIVAAYYYGDLPVWLARSVAAVFAGQAVWVLYLRARVGAVIGTVDEAAHDLDLFASLLRVLEHETFTSPRLQALGAALARTHRPASAEIARLDQLGALLASRSNLIAAIPAALTFWGTQLALAIDAWRTRLSADVPRWLDVIGEFDALLALAAFAAEHPDHAYPLFEDGAAHVDAHGLAHPLLPRSAVANDVRLGGSAPHLLVVSGSNMSGKSTLMRALGLNVVLAQAGAPVRATGFVLTPLAIGASIRVNDSLADGKSRFYAEIVRLKAIVDLVSTHGGHVLFLLDEILSGTNSHDRRHGAQALLMGLVDRGAVGIVTTHDLALGAIADQLGERATNMHLEDQFADGVMTFDYRLRPGVVQTSNAVALMRSIGLDV